MFREPIRSLGGFVPKMMLALALAAAALGCGGSSNPNSPSAISQIPNVAGTYTGPIIWTADGATVLTFSGRLTVVQASSQLTITGSLTYQGQTFPIAAVTGNVNATGFFTSTSTGGSSTTFDPTCGTLRGVDESLTFSGNSAQYVEHDTSQFCGAWTFSGTLTR